MGILASNNKTLLDVAKETDANGKLPVVIELLSEENEILDDIPWIECNSGDAHKTSIRTGLPTPVWRKMYQGVPPSKGTTAVIQDTCAMMEARSEIDKDLADLNGNAASFRLREDVAHLEGMTQVFANCLFYGSEVKQPGTFTGLAPRFSDATAKNGRNILCDKQNTTAAKNTSIWLIAWDDSTIHGIYPKGLKAGFEAEDLGVIDAFDENKNRFRAYASRYAWKPGLTVRDWRYVVRIIFDTSNLKADRSTGADICQLMEIALERIKSTSKGRLAWYMNKTSREMLRLQLKDNAKYQLTRETVAGRQVTAYAGIPIRTCEAITDTEAKVKTA